MKLKIIIILVISSFGFFAASAAAFNPFCTTDSSGACVSGPCKDNPKAPTCQQAANQGGNSTNRLTGTGNIINSAADILAVVTGIGAVIMIIIGSLTLATSGGNAEAVAGARRRIIYSLIGLVVVALAWSITRFITDRLVQ